MNTNKERIAIFLPSLSGGGVAPCFLKLANYFHTQGHPVDLLLGKYRGPHLGNVPEGIHIIPLQRKPKWIGQLSTVIGHSQKLGYWVLPIFLPLRPESDLSVIDSLTNYLQKNRPYAMLTAKTYTNIIGLIAREKADVKTKIVISERTHLSHEIIQYKNFLRWRYILSLVKKWYKHADAITAVSTGVAQDLIDQAQLDQKQVHVIYNPTINESLERRKMEEVNHPWFKNNQASVLLAIGRLHEQKDFPTLLHAFAKVRKNYNVRLVILGEGPQRKQLEQLIKELELTHCVDLPGFVNNPYAYLSRSTMFILSSTYEGLPNSLIEALACGTPVISTCCPSGPEEILDHGRYGQLIPVGDQKALAQSIETYLTASIERDSLKTRGYEFSVTKTGKDYYKLIFQNGSST